MHPHPLVGPYSPSLAGHKVLKCVTSSVHGRHQIFGSIPLDRKRHLCATGRSWKQTVGGKCLCRTFHEMWPVGPIVGVITMVPVVAPLAKRATYPAGNAHIPSSLTPFFSPTAPITWPHFYSVAACSPLSHPVDYPIAVAHSRMSCVGYAPPLATTVTTNKHDLTSQSGTHRTNNIWVVGAVWRSVLVQHSPQLTRRAKQGFGLT